MIKRIPLLFILFITFSKISYSQQNFTITKNIDWLYETRILKEGAKPTPLANSNEATLSSEGVPFILIDQQLEQRSEVSVVLKNIKTSLADPILISPLIQVGLNTEFSYKTAISTQNKKPVVSIAVCGLRRNANNEIELLTAMDIEITVTPSLNKTIGSTTFKPKSILSEGTVYKLAITSTGLYKIDYNFLKNLGYDMNSINPKNLHIYGRGGGMMPKANNAPREDDLPENAIYVYGDGDGKFDPQDYAVFYGKGQTTWKCDNGKYTHISNYYDETTYYFLSVDQVEGKRIAIQPNPSGTPNKTTDSGDEYFVHEINKVNDYQSGAELLGESFSKTNTQNFKFSISNIIQGEDISFRSLEVAHSVSSVTSFSISNNGIGIQTRNCSTIEESFDKPYYSSNLFGTVAPMETTFKSNTDNFDIQCVFYKGSNSDARGWLDYFEVVARRKLTQGGGQMGFRDYRTVGSANITTFNLNTGTQKSKVWDVTDCTNIKEINTTHNNGITSFNAETFTLREFESFTDAAVNFYVPASKGLVDKQYLHSSPFADLIIVAYPDFLTQANRLAEHRRVHDGLRVIVTTPQLIYNEFSSGAQDITAIREFVRMFYNRATTSADEPKYLLLFGDASFNYKEASVFSEADNRFYTNTNFVPTFESPNFYDTDSYASDDYFGLLDDDEGAWPDTAFEGLDIGIGRLPVDNAEQAQQIVDKILRYESAEALGDWRNTLMYVADDQDNNSHLQESELVSNVVTGNHPEFNINKIYLDAYKQISLGSGYSYPDATNAVNRGLQKGALVLNYTGHGSSIQLAHESLLTASRDIVNWKNKYQMPLFFTATCEFTEFDHIAKVSAGEDVIMNPNGGGIGLLTTTRVAFSNVNSALNVNFNANNAFEKTAAGGSRLGDIMKLTKNKNGVNSNPSAKHFILLGDPSMRLAVPKYNVVTTAINNKPVSTANDTLKALQKVSIEGFVADPSGDTINNFNGEVSVIVYDKPGNYNTMANDADSYKQAFTMQKNFIFKGIAAVVNGNFKIDLVIPKDIAYNFGYGKISYYAFDKTRNIDGAGSYTKIVIGGSDNSAVPDNNGPVVKLFINDTTFMNGGTTHQNPVLIVKLFDENGINTSGVSIGHEMTSTLDRDVANPSILNDFYEGTLNDFQRGSISYPYYNLALGNHTITVKVWDIYNNSGTGSINFIVIDKNEFKIDKLMSYPNPFMPAHGDAIFSFEHNKAGESLDVTIEIFSSYGQKIRTLNIPQTNGSTRFNELSWNGENELGGPLASGTYIFKATVKDKNGNIAQQSSRLVLIR